MDEIFGAERCVRCVEDVKGPFISERESLAQSV